jgi:putative transposase
VRSAEGLGDLDRSFAHFYRRVKEKKAGRKIKVSSPRFKSKKNVVGSFSLTGANHMVEKAIQLPRLGLLRLKERGYLPVEGSHLERDRQ